MRNLAVLGVLVGMVAAQPAHATSVFIVPHQDDETISMGEPLARACYQGDRVIVALVTDGRGSSAYGHINRRLGRDLTRRQFSRARTREMRAALNRLCEREQYELKLIGVRNGGMTQEQANRVIGRFAKNHPTAEFWTTSAYDAHPEHAMLGIALAQATVTHGITAYEAVQRPSWEAAPGLYALETGVAVAGRVQRASLEYRRWRPRSHRYAVGWTSVPGLLTDTHNDPNTLFIVSSERMTDG